MKSISVRDLRKIPALAGYKEMELISPELDKVVEPWLYALGLDTRQDAEITVNLHRDMNNVAAVGYRIVGEIRTDREYVQSGFCDVIERIIIAGKHDPSMIREMANMMNHTIDFKAFSGPDDDVIPENDFPASEIDTDYESNSKLMATLQSVLNAARPFKKIRYGLTNKPY